MFSKWQQQKYDEDEEEGEEEEKKKEVGVCDIYDEWLGLKDYYHHTQTHTQKHQTRTHT